MEYSRPLLGNYFQIHKSCHRIFRTDASSAACHHNEISSIGNQETQEKLPWTLYPLERPDSSLLLKVLSSKNKFVNKHKTSNAFQGCFITDADTCPRI